MRFNRFFYIKRKLYVIIYHFISVIIYIENFLKQNNIKSIYTNIQNYLYMYSVHIRFYKKNYIFFQTVKTHTVLIIIQIFYDMWAYFRVELFFFEPTL